MVSFQFKVCREIQPICEKYISKPVMGQAKEIVCEENAILVNEDKCVLCRTNLIADGIYGELYKYEDISVHSHCLVSISNSIEQIPISTHHKRKLYLLVTRYMLLQKWSDRRRHTRSCHRWYSKCRWGICRMLQMQGKRGHHQMLQWRLCTLVSFTMWIRWRMSLSIHQRFSYLLPVSLAKGIEQWARTTVCRMPHMPRRNHWHTSSTYSDMLCVQICLWGFLAPSTMHAKICIRVRSQSEVCIMQWA